MCAVSRSIRLAKEMQKREEEEEGKDGLEKRQRGLELKNNRQTDKETYRPHASYTPSATCYHSYS